MIDFITGPTPTVQSSAENTENAKNYQKLMTELPQHFLLLQLREVDFSWWT